MTGLSWFLVLAGIVFTPALVIAAPMVAWLEWRHRNPCKTASFPS